MKKSLITFFQAVIVLIGISTLVFILWEPHLEGRNANAAFSQVYFNDPFLAYAYIASILFFIALYQAFKVLKYIKENKTFSPETLKALRTIKYCLMAFIGCVIIGLIIIVLNRGDDDAAGGVFMGGLVIFGSAVIAIAAAMYERTLQRSGKMKPETA